MRYAIDNERGRCTWAARRAAFVMQSANPLSLRPGVQGMVTELNHPRAQRRIISSQNLISTLWSVRCRDAQILRPSIACGHTMARPAGARQRVVDVSRGRLAGLARQMGQVSPCHRQST